MKEQKNNSQAVAKFSVINRKSQLKIILTYMVLLSACSNDEIGSPQHKAVEEDPVFKCETDAMNPLVGCWTSERCTKTNSVPIYTEHEKYTLAYLKSGHVVTLYREWNNSDCSGDTINQEIIAPYTYESRSESIVTEEGIAANVHKVVLSDTSLNTFFVAHVIDNERICMTPGIVGEIRTYKYKSIEELPKTIDYENCLIKEYVEYNE